MSYMVNTIPEMVWCKGYLSAHLDIWSIAMSNIIVIYDGKVNEYANFGGLLDWIVKQITTPQPEKVEEKVEVRPEIKTPAPTKGDRALEKILAPETPKEEKRPAVPNQFDLPPMRKPFFGGKDKGEMLSFLYSINGEFPKHRPADCARIIFTNTEAYRDMPAKAKDKILNWGLSFLKKECRETGKSASCETKMVRAFSHDRFSFLAGQKVIFKVAINHPKSA